MKASSHTPPRSTARRRASAVADGSPAVDDQVGSPDEEPNQAAPAAPDAEAAEAEGGAELAAPDALPARDEIDPDEVEVIEPEVEPRRQTGLSQLRDPVDRFLSEARRYPRLSEDEERQLGLRVRQRGDMDAARKLVVHNLRLVVAIAY